MFIGIEIVWFYQPSESNIKCYFKFQNMPYRIFI